MACIEENSGLSKVCERNVKERSIRLCIGRVRPFLTASQLQAHAIGSGLRMVTVTLALELIERVVSF